MENTKQLLYTEDLLICCFKIRSMYRNSNYV